ncbi:MAG: molybdenum ABC transporter ATP-binding protein [Planctomycetes bacterium]|nr:molybdenum ABC transporter ATP-binding protein [Planctomycetota bacterium]
MIERAAVRFDLPLPPFVLSVDFGIGRGTTVLFGPSGAGKTTLLETIAGIRRPASGEISIGDVVVFSSSREIDLPPERRRIGWLPQDALLFPHLGVERNLRFGAPPRLSADRFRRVVDVLEIGPLLGRHTTALSGGERRRVALGRAILSEPRLLLLDEPLAGVDVALRQRLLPYMRRITQDPEWATPTLLVTHDLAEARSLASVVVLLDGGTVIGQGPPESTLMLPAALAAAEEMGLDNVFEARVVERLAADGVMRVRSVGGLEIVVPNTEGRDVVSVRIGASDVLVATRRPEGLSAQNVVAGRIAEIAAAPRGRLLRVAAGEEMWVKVTARAVSDLDLEPGREIFLIWKAQSSRVS